MAILLAGLGTLFTSGGAAAAGGAAATGAAAAGSGFSLAGILQGITTVGGLVASISAGNQDAAAATLAASDAEQEKQLEVLQGIDRRRSIRRALSDATGAMDTAYAASGVDLSFGTAAEARKSAYREADLGLTSDTSTEMTRVGRLTERAANYRSSAKRAKQMGLFNGLVGVAGNAASFLKRG